ncbi:MAG: PEP-CTERM sorting domain-containing protein [Phycisphaerales bacterium]|nr:PEP-CTERM sorting domain-containing protein [Phycisphaerales bacterium]
MNVETSGFGSGRRYSARGVTVAAFGLAAASQAASGQVSFQEVPDLPHAAIRGYVNGMSRDGVAVVGGAPVPGEEAFLWTAAGGTLGLGDLPGGGFTSFATQAAAGGQVVVGGSEYAPALFQTFRWTPADGMQGLGFLPGGLFSHAIAVSDDGGVIIGQSDSSDGTQPYRWTADTGMVGLGRLPGGGSSAGAFAMSSDGSVVVGQSESASGFEAFRWSAMSGMESLGTLSASLGPANIACAMSADASVIFGGAVSDASAPNPEAFMWTAAGGMVGLGDLAGGVHSSIVYSCSADGRIAVGSGSTGSGEEAFIWDAVNGMKSLREVLVNDFGLDLDGWTLTIGVSISADGRTIAGSGVNPRGEPANWITTVPRYPLCPADLNGDGLVDFSDYLEFLNYYDAQDPRVDYTGDGLVDFSDYLAFLNHYDAGC